MFFGSKARDVDGVDQLAEDNCHSADLKIVEKSHLGMYVNNTKIRGKRNKPMCQDERFSVV